VLANETDPDVAWKRVAKLQQEAMDAALGPTPKQAAPKAKPTLPAPGPEAGAAPHAAAPGAADLHALSSI
jgi:hypothetical protein